jgi:hypothetical protein
MDTSLQGQKARQANANLRRYDGVNGRPLYDSSNNGHYGMFARPPTGATIAAVLRCSHLPSKTSLS